MTKKFFERGKQIAKWADNNMAKDNGYWCVICQRFIEANKDGLIVHDDITHPNNMTFDDEERPQ
jgi:hypothetical protein